MLLHRARLGVGLILLLVAAVMALPAQAQVKLDINQGRVEPRPIAVTTFPGDNDQTRQMGIDISKVIAADLDRSGLFKPLDEKGFIQQFTSLDVQPVFANWRALSAMYLVQGAVDVQPNGQLRVAFRLWDVFEGTQLDGKAFVTQPENTRRVAHIIADAIYTALTGESGYFDTRIVYVAESGPAIKKTYRLAIMDQDGANHRYLTDGANIVLSPRFSPTLQQITYLSYFGQRPRVYIFSIDTGRQELLGEFQGMSYAPRFSPDGNKVVFSLATDGNSDVYEMNLSTRKSSRLTTVGAIDTAPSYSPKGDQIAFESDRSGGQQIYVMNADGSDQKRITFDSANSRAKFATPVWSPRGDLIAFTKQLPGKFQVGVIRPDGTGARILAEGPSGNVIQGPTWAPNGRVLMYYAEGANGGPAKLFSIDLTGYNQREILTPGNASDPAWSPLIP